MPRLVRIWDCSGKSTAIPNIGPKIVDPRILLKRHLAGNNDTHHVIAAAIAAKRCIHSREYNRLDWRSTLRCAVAAGKQVGGSVLVLAGRYRPVSLSLSMDNAMPAVFGTGQVVTSVSANSLLGLGEQITVQAAGLPEKNYDSEFPTRRYLNGTFSIPLGIDAARIVLRSEVTAESAMCDRRRSL
jgi:hypothetical protein